MLSRTLLLVWLASTHAACAPLLGDYQVVEDVDAEGADSGERDDTAPADGASADGGLGDSRIADDSAFDNGPLPDTRDVAADTACLCGDPGCCPGVVATDCCSGRTCPLLHDTGLGPTYWYCAPLGTPGTPATYTKLMAQAAATAWGEAGTMGSDASYTWATRPGSTVLNACWAYAGAIAGRAAILGGPSSACGMITTGGPKTWN